MIPLMKLLYEVLSAGSCVGLSYNALFLARCRDTMAQLQDRTPWSMKAAYFASNERLPRTIWASRVYGKMAHLFVAGRLCEDVSEQLYRLPCEVTPL